MNAISLNRVLNTSVTSIPHSRPIPQNKPVSADALKSADSSRQTQPTRGKDTVEISPKARQQIQETEKPKSISDLSAEEKAQVSKLQKADRETRAHEQAHLGAAGGLARGGASFTFTKGPDGRLYAVGGEVSIDTSPIPGDPDATIRKADTIRRAALAPSEPSSQDKAVAAQAAKMANEARSEKLSGKQSDTLEGALEVNGAKVGRPKVEDRFNPTVTLGDLLDLVA